MKKSIPAAFSYHSNLIKALGDLRDWRYAGGYYHKQKKGGSLLHRDFLLDLVHEYGLIIPDYKTECECTHWIIYDFYVINKTNTRLALVGSHCIDQFIDRVELKCSRCEKTHKNRKDNYCNECRIIRKSYNEKMPFGIYEGQMIKNLAKDKEFIDYFLWLKSTDWYDDRQGISEFLCLC